MAGARRDPVPPDTHRRNLTRLFALRWVALAATVVLLTVAVAIIGMPLSVPSLGAAVNFWTGLRIRSPEPIADITLFWQLLADTATLAVVLYCSGGWSNPFVSLFLLPLVIAATLLPARLAWLVAAVTLGAYTLLGVLHSPMPHVHDLAGADFDLHEFGMWLSFVISAAVVSGVVVHMARSLRDRDRDRDLAYLERAVAGWRALRPGVELSIAWDGPQPAPPVIADRTLGQTLVSLLNNAADASPQGVELECRWDSKLLTVDIRDHGEGVVPGVARLAGRRRVSTKSGGQGVGLMIAASAIERFGGRVTLSNREQGTGARTRVEIPLLALIAG